MSNVTPPRVKINQKIQSKLVEVLNATFHKKLDPKKPPNNHLHLYEIGLSQLYERAILIQELEEKFPEIVLQDHDLDHISTFGQLVKLIETKLEIQSVVS